MATMANGKVRPGPLAKLNLRFIHIVFLIVVIYLKLSKITEIMASGLFYFILNSHEHEMCTGH